MYTQFYRFAKKPFQLTPDPEFFFNSPVHKRALAYLRYGLTQGEGFVVVTGAPGTGKTTLVKALFQSLQQNVIAGLMVTSQVGAEDTLRIISATFGLSYDGDDKATLLRNLERFFQDKSKEGKRVLLVVDEAQNLPLQSLEELRMLSNFELGGKPLFQAFLLGQEEFRLALQSDRLAQVRQRVIATYHLRPLTLAETQAYILHRLKLAGWQLDPRFKEEAFALVHRFTGGVPRVINTLCDRLLLFAYLEELHEIDAQAVKVVVDEIQQDLAAPTELKGCPQEAVNPVLKEAQVPQSWPYLERLEKLERRVAELERIVQREQGLLRKAILLNLDLDAAYTPVDRLASASRLQASSPATTAQARAQYNEPVAEELHKPSREET